MKIDFSTGRGFNLIADIEHHVCVLSSKSGTGKSYFFDLLAVWAKGAGYTVHRYSSANAPVRPFLFESQERSIMILDDAELYLSLELMKALYGKYTHIFIASHDIIYMPPNSDAAFYNVDYTFTEMKVRPS